MFLKIGAKLLSVIPISTKVQDVGDIGEYINGYAFKPKDWGIEGLPIIRIQNLNDSKKPYNFYKGHISKKYLIKKGDILISWSASLGTYIWPYEDAWLNQHIFKGIPNSNLVTKIFFYYSMLFAIEYISKNARGSTMKHVNAKDFKNSEIVIPPFPEQHKIAAILSLVQKAIEQQTRLIELTNELKKALMHKIFTEGLRSEPQMITEIGPVPESWETRKLGDLTSFQTGGTPSRENKKYWVNGNIPWVKTTEIVYQVIKGS